MLFCRNIINLLVVPSLAAAAIDIDHQSAVAVANTNSDEDNNNNENNRAKDKVNSNRILTTNLFARTSSSSGKSKRSDNSNGKSGKKRPKNRKSKTDKGSTSNGPSQHPTTTTVTFRIQSCGLACPQGYTGSQPLDGCTGYVGCDNGVAKEPIACPPGLLYDENLGYCNFPDSVTCNCGTSLPPSTQTPTVKPSLLPNDSPRIISVTVVEPGGGLKTVNCCGDGGFDECSVLLSIGQVEVEECPSTPPPTISMAPSTSPPSTSPTTRKYECFGANDGGREGILYDAVRAYVRQDCANNQECDIGEAYGWPINSWCLGNVKSMNSLFEGMDTFNEDINGWNTSSATDMRYMFAGATAFNGDVSSFNTSSVTTMRSMFGDATAFNGDVSSFNTSSVTSMRSMFYQASSFNQDVSNFDTSSVTTMYGLFWGASLFNGDMTNFDTSSVTDMSNMFSGAKAFNGDLSNFDTSSVTDMEFMFRGATLFNGDVSNFNTSKVTDMRFMFYRASSFNQDVSSFDLSKVTDMTYMFEDARLFNQDLCAWRDSFPYTNAEGIFTNSGCTHKDTPNETQKGPFCAFNCQ